MNPIRTVLPAAWALALAGVAARGAEVTGRYLERESNVWPFVVESRAGSAGNLHAWTGAGPLLFSQPAADREGRTARGFRPFWVEFEATAGHAGSRHLLYPLFSLTQDETSYRWSVFELIRRQGRRAGAPAPTETFDQRHEFEIFPFWFERDFAEPELNYRALFPLHGTVRQKLGIERVSWTLFPLYAESERRGAVTQHFPWPFLRRTTGAAHGGGFWPFYTTYERPGESSATYLLWPLVYRLSRQPTPDDPPGTPERREVGVLPFYAASSGPGYASETFLWPFFGHTERTRPVPYREHRYLWPFWVQGRGEDRFVNRWGPFYTHSILKGYDKQWIAWPLYREARWVDEGIARQRRQVLYFLFWHEEQRAAGRPTAPAAELTHVWPFFSGWDNGAGRRQWQLFSPLEVFFPGNAKVRQTWSPLFAIARHDQRAPGHTRTSFLWNAITAESQPVARRAEFHLGPLLSIARAGDERRIAVGNGLFGLHRAPAGGWRWFWWEYPARAHVAAPAESTPPSSPSLRP